MTGPAAEGARIEWQELPGPVQAAIEGVCGAGVVQARTQPGGFSPGLAARVRCANGARYFVKAVSAQANPDTPRLHRQEGRVLAALEPVISGRQLPVPRLHAIVDQPPWVALVLQDVPGRQPKLPWHAAELQQVVAAVDQLAQALTPAPVPVPAVSERLGAEFTGWRTLATSAAGDRLDPWSRAHLDQLAALEATWAGHVAGDTLAAAAAPRTADGARLPSRASHHRPPMARRTPLTVTRRSTQHDAASPLWPSPHHRRRQNRHYA